MNEVSGMEELERAQNIIQDCDDMVLAQNSSIFDRFKYFLDVRFYIVHHEKQTVIGLTAIIVFDPVQKNDVVKLRCENVVRHFRKLSHDVNLPDELFQIMDVIRDIGDQFYSVDSVVMLAFALHDFAVRALSEQFFYYEVLLDIRPMMGVFNIVFVSLIHIFRNFI